MAPDKVTVAILAPSRYDAHSCAHIVQGGLNGTARSTRTKHDDGNIHEGTLGGTVKGPPAKGVEHPSKAHKIGIVCIDAAIAAPDQGVCDSQPHCPLAPLVSELEGIALVGNGDVNARPVSLPYEAADLLWLYLEEGVGD